MTYTFPEFTSFRMGHRVTQAMCQGHFWKGIFQVELYATGILLHGPVVAQTSPHVTSGCGGI